MALAVGWAFFLVPWNLKLEHNYQRALFQELSDRLTQENRDPQEAVLRLLHFVHTRVIGSPALRPLGDVEPAIILGSGRGGCDQRANVLIQLMRPRSIDGRLVFLQDGNGRSPHSVAEFYIDGNWRVVDPTLGIPLYNSAGRLATREELVSNPNLFEQIPPISSRDRLASVEIYRHEPVVFNTWRGKRVEWLDCLPDRVRRLAVCGLQELYLTFSASVRALPEPDRLLQRARHYTLLQRFPAAEQAYEKLLRGPNELVIRQEARLGLARVYRDIGRPEKALTVLQTALDEDHDENRIAAIHLLRGRLYQRLGHPDSAIQEYRQGGVLEDALALARIKQLTSELQSAAQ